MKSTLKQRLLLASISLALSAPSAFSATETFNSVGTFNWVCPGGVTSIQVECWGGGGAGGAGRKDADTNTNSQQNGGGGGGGAYARRVAVPVTAGQTYSVTIPAVAVSGSAGTTTNGSGRVNGSNVTFVGNSSVTVTAAGGTGGANAYVSGSNTVVTASGGAGGVAISPSVGDVGALFAGGAGATSTATTAGASGSGGGGGGSAFAGSAGTATTASTSTTTPVALLGGTGGSTGGGNGGSGFGAGSVAGNASAGGSGAVAGGGGGGGHNVGQATKLGGNGGAGQIKITYSDPATNVKADNATNLNLAGSWTAYLPNFRNIAEWNNTVASANTTVLGADLALSGIKISNPGGPVIINAGNTLTLGSATQNFPAAIAIDLSAATQDLTVNAPVVLPDTRTANVWDVASGRTLTLSGVVSGSSAVTKQGVGTVTLSGASNYTGNTTVTGGTLNVTGTLTGNTTSSALTPGTTAANTVVNVSNNVTLFKITGAAIAGSASVYNQTAGTVNVTPTGGQALTTTAGYGFFNLTGGLFKVNAGHLLLANGTGAAGVGYVGGSGAVDLTGTGSSNGGLAFSGTGSLTVGPGGTVTRGPAGGAFYFTAFANSLGILNVAGGSMDLGTGIVRMGNGTTISGLNAFVNLDSGTLNMGAAVTNSASASGGNLYANYAGGTLKASATLTNPFTTGSGITTVSTIFGGIDNTAAVGNTSQNFTGGLTVDTNGFAVTYGNALLAATGNGVKQANMTVTGGTGYIGAPLVQFTGGTLAANGTPASGYAVISGGAVTGIVITSPGAYTADPTVTLTGGGGTGAGIALSALTANPADTGLTKTGTGTLTLSGANTYTGPTLVSNGALQLNVDAATAPATGSLTVSATGALGFTAATASTLGLTAGSLTLGGGTVAFDMGSSGVNDTISVNNFTLSANSAFTFNLLNAVTGGSTYTLLSSTNAITNSGPFTISGQVFGKLTLTPVINSNTITVTPNLDEAGWNQSGSGNWNVSGNWTPYQPTAAGDAALFGSAITGPATVTVDSPQSAGYLRFNNANAYTIGSNGSSNLTIDNGVYSAFAVVNTGSHAIAENITLASNLNVAPVLGTTLTLSGTVSGVGKSLQLTDTGTLVLSGANTYTGGTVVNVGTLKLSGIGTAGATGSTVAVNSGALLDLNGTNQSITFAAGTGIGTVANNSGGGTSMLTLSGTPTINGSFVTIVDNTNSTTGKVAVTITGNTQVLSNLNTYSGGTTVNAGGFLYLVGSLPLGAGTGPINLTSLGVNGATSSGLVVDGAIYANDITGAGYVHNNSNSGATVVTTTFTGNINTSGPFIFRAGTGIVYNFAGNGTTSVLSGVIGSTTSMVNGAVATGSIIKSGTGTLTLSGVSVYSGSTTISGGTLQLGDGTTGNDGTISSSSSIINNASLIYNRFGTLSSSVPISGTGTVTKLGAGTQTLAGASTYTGATTISEGILKIGNATALGAQTGTTDGTTIAAGATLDLAGIATGVAAERLTASGTGVGGNGAIISSAAIATPFIGVRYLTLAGNTTLGFTNRWDVGSSTAANNGFVGGGYTLNVTGTGAGQASFNFLGDTDLGDINLNLGNAATAIMYLQGSTTLGRAANTITITGGSTLNVFSNSTVAAFDKKFALDNGNIVVAKTGGTSLDGTISLANTNIVTTTTATAVTNVISGTGSLIKSGASTLTLGNSNTYTGNTSITAGTLVLASAGQLKFVLGATSGTTNSISGAGTLTADGSFNIDTATADALATGSWTLENVTGGGYGSTFSVVGFTDAGGNKWTKANGLTKIYTFDEATGILTLGPAGYASWSGGAAFDADANSDGVKNGMAWVLGATDPSANAIGLLPTFDNTTDPTYFIYTYRRADSANTDPNTTITMQYGSDLAGWTTAVDDGSNIIITLTDNFYGASPGVDKVEVKIKRTLAVGGKLFGRLNTVQAP